MESTIKLLNKKKQQQVTVKEDNNLTLLKQVNNQNEDYQKAAMNSIPGLIIFEVFVVYASFKNFFCVFAKLSF